MKPNLLSGKLVHLTADDPQVMADAFARWGHDSEFLRLEDSGPAMLFSSKKIKEFVEKDDQNSDSINFAIRTLDGDRLVGMIGLMGMQNQHGEAFVGIGIGERELWGKGYGTDAMRIILRYAFCELNLRRVSLNVFAYNPRAIHSYEKAGFVHEGRERGRLHRDGRRWDLVYMGILREEWSDA